MQSLKSTGTDHVLFFSSDCVYANLQTSLPWFNMKKPLPSSDCSRGFGKVQSRIFRDLDSFLHSGQQTLTSLSSEGWAKTLWTSDEELHDHICIFFHTLTWHRDKMCKNGSILVESILLAEHCVNVKWILQTGLFILYFNTFNTKRNNIKTKVFLPLQKTANLRKDK